MSGWTKADQDLLLGCRDLIRSRLIAQQEVRGSDPEWVANERRAVAYAANDFALAHGLRAVTVADVERIEAGAVGHYDYTSKLALYVAEVVLGVSPGPRP